LRALFIGGPWDGRLIEHTLESDTMHVPEWHSPSFINYGNSVEETPKHPTFTDWTYVRFSIAGYDFMVEQQLYERGVRGRGKHPMQVVMDLLSQGYRRPSDIYGDI
jgi:hypothetical protein